MQSSFTAHSSISHPRSCTGKSGKPTRKCSSIQPQDIKFPSQQNKDGCIWPQDEHKTKAVWDPPNTSFQKQSSESRWGEFQLLHDHQKTRSTKKKKDKIFFPTDPGCLHFGTTVNTCGIPQIGASKCCVQKADGWTVSSNLNFPIRIQDELRVSAFCYKHKTGKEVQEQNCFRGQQKASNSCKFEKRS